MFPCGYHILQAREKIDGDNFSTISSRSGDSLPALWLTDDAEHLSYLRFRRITVRYSKLADIYHPPMHFFRHAFAFNSCRVSAGLISTQQSSGHADLNVLWRYLAQTKEDFTLAHRIGSPLDNNRMHILLLLFILLRGV